MDYEKSILIAAIIIGIFQFKRTTPMLLKRILVGLIVSITLSFFDNTILKFFSLLTFGVLSLVFSIHSLINKKWFALVIGFFVFISFVFKSMHFPYANELSLLMVIPILCYLLILKKWKYHLNRLSILTFFVAYQLGEFITLIETWQNN